MRLILNYDLSMKSQLSLIVIICLMTAISVAVVSEIITALKKLCPSKNEPSRRLTIWIVSFFSFLTFAVFSFFLTFIAVGMAMPYVDLHEQPPLQVKEQLATIGILFGVLGFPILSFAKLLTIDRGLHFGLYDLNLMLLSYFFARLFVWFRKKKSSKSGNPLDC
jgi:hypothetical protein